MKMEDWGQNSNDFFKMTKKEILAQKGTKFLWWNLKKFYEEYEKYYVKNLTKAEKDYIEVLKLLVFYN